PGPFGRVDPHALVADDDEVAGPDAVHRHGAGPGAALVEARDDDAAVHLRVLDRDPPAADLHVGGEVGGGAEPGGQDAGPVGGDELGVAPGGAAGAVHGEPLAQHVEGGLVVVVDAD